MLQITGSHSRIVSSASRSALGRHKHTGVINKCRQNTEVQGKALPRLTNHQEFFGKILKRMTSQESRRNIKPKALSAEPEAKERVMGYFLLS